MATGLNSVVIRVTAQDGITTKEYILWLTKPAPANAEADMMVMAAAGGGGGVLLLCLCLAFYCFYCTAKSFKELDEEVVPDEIEKPEELDSLWNRPKILSKLTKLREDKAVAKRRLQEAGEQAIQRRKEMEAWMREKEHLKMQQALDTAKVSDLEVEVAKFQAAAAEAKARADASHQAAAEIEKKAT